MLLQLFADAAEKLSFGRREFCSATSQALANAHHPTPCHLNFAQGPRHFGQRTGMLEDYQKRLALRHRLVCIDPTNAQWRHDEACILDRIGEEYRRVGLAHETIAVYEVSVAIWRQLAKVGPRNQQLDLSISLGKLGDARLAVADSVGAIAAYEESVVNWRRLLKQNAENSFWQIKLAEGLEKIGDLKLQAGDNTGALTAYEDMVIIDRGLVEIDGSNTEWQWNLSLSLDRIGDVELGLGHTNAARLAYEQSLALRRRLVEVETSTSRWQDGVSLSLRKIVDLKHLVEERAAAHAAQSELRGVDRLLFEIDHINSELQERLSLGANESNETKKTRNLATLEESLAIRRQLALSYPTNPRYRYDLSVDLEELADVRLQLSEVDEALSARQESLAIRRRLADAAQNNRKLQQDLCSTLEKVGDLKQTENDQAAALSLYEESLRIRRRLIEFDNSDQTSDGLDAALGVAPTVPTKRHGGNAQRRRDVNGQLDIVLTLKKIAIAKLNAFDNSGARAALHESLAISRHLLWENKTSYVSDAWQNLALSFARMNTALFLLEGYRNEASALLGKISARTWAATQGSQRTAKTVRLTIRQLSRRYRKGSSIFFGEILARGWGLQSSQRAVMTVRLVMKRLSRRHRNCWARSRPEHGLEAKAVGRSIMARSRPSAWTLLGSAFYPEADVSTISEPRFERRRHLHEVCEKFLGSTGRNSLKSAG